MIICDTHCDTLYNLQTAPGQPLDVTYERLKAGGVSVQTMAMYVGPGRKGCDVEALMAGMLQHLENLKLDYAYVCARRSMRACSITRYT